MPRDHTGKNRKFGKHQEREVEDITEESLMMALQKAKVEGNNRFLRIKVIID